MGSGTSKGTWEFTDPALLQEKRNSIIHTISRREGVNFI